MTMSLSDLMIYPVKGMAGMRKNSAQLFIRGLENDRQWMICDTMGNALGATRHPSMRLIHIDWEQDAFVFSAPGLPPIKDWDDVDAWLSDFLGMPCRLVNVERKLNARHGGRISFSHGFPLLLQTRETLDDLNARLEHPIPAMQLRPNLVISGAPAPYAEDDWRVVRIGDILCDVNGPCARCPNATIDPEKGRMDPREEPLATLATYRRDKHGNINLGIHLTPRQEGIIQTGAPVEIIE